MPAAQPGPENRQGLKKELWTRIIRTGDEYRGAARLHVLLDDMISFFENPPAAVESEQRHPSKQASRAAASSIAPQATARPWTLLFDPEACDLEHTGKTLQEMELPEA